MLSKAGNRNIFPADKDTSTRRDGRGLDGAARVEFGAFTPILTSLLRLGSRLPVPADSIQSKVRVRRSLSSSLHQYIAAKQQHWGN